MLHMTDAGLDHVNRKAQGSAPSASGRGWILLAASGPAAAEAYAHAHGLEVRRVLEKPDLRASPRGLRRIARETGADGAIVHSTGWRRERTPQIFELALFLIPLKDRFIVDEGAGLVHRVSSPGLALRLARMPADGVWDAIVVATEVVRLTRRHGSLENQTKPPTARRPSVLAVWPGSSATAGGSLTHITGILGAFRRSGVRVGLLTRFPIPDRLQAVVDDFEVALPLSEASRLTWDTEQLGANASLRRAGRALARRLEPTFVYQRHCPFLVAGADLAESLGVPLVLEWNGSEAWIRRNWSTGDEQAPGRAKGPLDRLLLAMERNVVTRASVISAVSNAAAEMAFEVGAEPSRTLVVPNAVDVAELDAELETASATRDGSGALLGWAGSFGPWHGAELAVRGLSKLPADVRLRMIGDGNERRACVDAAEALGIADRVEMTGALPRGEALRRLAECDVLLSPHTPLRDQPFFGSPTKIFEYMALGKPIVVSRLGQLGELFEDGVTARTVTPGDPDELAGAVMEILRSADRGHALGKAARRVAEREHSWDDRARTILERLEIPVGPRRAAGRLQED
jgi:glycosyltransferase involved in cell wall biosynthesis